MYDVCCNKSKYFVKCFIKSLFLLNFCMVYFVYLLENDLFDMLNEVVSVVIQVSKYVIIF